MPSTCSAAGWPPRCASSSTDPRRRALDSVAALSRRGKDHRLGGHPAMSALAAPPTSTDGALRERVEALERDVFAALKPYQEPSTRDLRNDPLSRKRRVTERERWFERVRDEILGLARDPAWRDHALARELLLTLEDVRAEIALDRDALDEGWKVRYAMKIMHVVVQAMLRQLDHAAIDDPD